MGYGLAHFQVGENRIRQVHFQVHELRQRALLAHRKPRRFRQAIDILPRQRRADAHLHFARFHGSSARAPILDIANNQLIQIRQRGVPVVAISHKLHVTPPHPFLEPEGTGADRPVVIGVLGQVRAVVKMLGQHQPAAARQ